MTTLRADRPGNRATIMGVSVAAWAVPVMVIGQFAWLAMVPVAMVLLGAVLVPGLRVLRLPAAALAVAYAVPYVIWKIRADPAPSLSRDIHPLLAGALVVAALGVIVVLHRRAGPLSAGRRPAATTPDPGRGPREFPTRAVTGLVLLAAGLGYLVVELTVAAAWSNPTYDWLRHLVTDLGSTGVGPNHQGLLVSSPRHALMNAGFLAQGLLFAVALLLLSRQVPTRARIALIALAVAQAVGLGALAQFATSPTMGGLALAANITSGTLALLASNAAILVAGRYWRAVGLPRAIGLTGVGLGGAAPALALVLTVLSAPTGLAERVAIDSFIAWQILAGCVLVLTNRTTSVWPRRSSSVSPIAAGLSAVGPRVRGGGRRCWKGRGGPRPGALPVAWTAR